jgi:UDP-N-acetylmuramyl pentapeptide synthase
VLPKLGCPAITYGVVERAEVGASLVERHAGEQTFLLTAGNEAVPVRTRIIGDHHLANCLAAAAVGLVFGAELTAINAFPAGSTASTAASRSRFTSIVRIRPTGWRPCSAPSARSLAGG